MSKCDCTSKASYLLLRLFLGLLMLVAGLGKFVGEDKVFKFANYYNGFVDSQMAAFTEKTWLTSWMLWPYLHTLAYAEILVGAALVFGIKPRCALIFNGLLLLSLGFGMMLMKGYGTVANIGLYLAMTVAALQLYRPTPMDVCPDKE
jgi:uncharacterized membrane protein YphA (DoxX/SURF4 family)